MEWDVSRQAEWQMKSIFGLEKTIAGQLREAVRQLDEAETRLDDMATAVTEACLNAVEHAHACDPEKLVRVTMDVSGDKIVFRIYDEGHGIGLHVGKLGGSDPWEAENPRGWGLFLIASLADEYRFGSEGGLSFIEIQFQRGVRGDRDGNVV